VASTEEQALTSFDSVVGYRVRHRYLRLYWSERRICECSRPIESIRPYMG